MKKEILSKVLFPVGAIHKTEVRAIAEKYNLATKAKKDSTGICFIGERDFKKFIAQYLPAKAGDFRTLDGTKVGRHDGSVYYTLGQRRGLGLGGEGDRWFVVAKDLQKNIVFVERGTEHPALFCDELTATEMSWVSGAAPHFPFRCRVKTRYRQADQDCTIVSVENGIARIVFDQPQRAITPRQSVVFYSGDVCLGGAMIERAGPSYHDRGLPMPEVQESSKSQISSSEVSSSQMSSGTFAS
jgi:tRNA-specific 2-thiouridylase